MALALATATENPPGKFRVLERVFSGTLSVPASPEVFLAGIATLLACARNRCNVDLVRLDVPAALRPSGGEKWLPSLLRVVSPVRITAIADAERHEGLSRMMSAITGTIPTFFAPEPTVRPKSALARQLLTAGKIGRALEDSVVHPIDPGLTVQVGTPMGNDATMPRQRCLWAGETLGMPICHGDLDHRHRLTLWTTVPVLPTGWEQKAGWVADSLGVSQLRIISLHAYDGLVVGVHGTDRLFRGLGRLEGWDHENNALCIRLPSNVSPEDIGFVAWGNFRVDRDGRVRAIQSVGRQKRGTAGDAGVYFG